MTDEREAGTTNGVNPAVETGLARMKAAWRAQTWEPAVLAEYRRVLQRAKRPEDVAATIDRAIDETEGRYPPPVGVVAKLLREVPAPLPERRPYAPSLGVDEAALMDALEALERWPSRDAEYLPRIEEQVTAIRKRLPDHGARVDRLREDAKRRPELDAYPTGPRNGAVAAALSAVAVALAGLAA